MVREKPKITKEYNNGTKKRTWMEDSEITLMQLHIHVPFHDKFLYRNPDRNKKM